MQIGFCSFNTNFSNSVNFNGRIDKVIEAIKAVKNYKHARVTADEAIKIYNNLGYQTRLKAGSHVTVTASDGFEFSFQLPHGNEKRFISPFDVKRLQCAVNNDRAGLSNTIKI